MCLPAERTIRMLLLCGLLPAVGQSLHGCRCQQERVSTAQTSDVLVDLVDTEPALVADVEAAPVTDAAANGVVAGAPVEVSQPALADFTFSPPKRKVLFPTQTRFEARELPVGEARYRWNFGDGSAPAYGRVVQHTYETRQVEVWVTLDVTDGKGLHLKSRKRIPLDRLSVVPLGDLDTTYRVIEKIPAPPEAGEGSLRFVVFSCDSVDMCSAAVGSIISQLKPQLAVHMGEPKFGWQRLAQVALEPLRRKGIDAFPGGILRKDSNWPQMWAKKNLGRELISDKRYPKRYSFSFRGSYFALFEPSDGRSLGWIKQELRRARVYHNVFVLSPLPFHRFTQREERVVGDKFKFYEALVKFRMSLLISNESRVYYKAKYGELDVVSIDSLDSGCQRLAGDQSCQQDSLVVVDVEKGQLMRVFAVTGPQFDKVLDEAKLPKSVEVYVRGY